jgi:FkbM family methyltransferase
MWRLAEFALKLKGVGSIVRSFENPWLTIGMRLGLVRLPWFCYRIRKGSHRYAMLARPSTTAMADLFVLREVFIDETYRELLPLLPQGPVRVVDVGANLGSFTVWLHARHGIREAHCFEPDPSSANLCRFNFAGNQCDLAQVIPKAVGGTPRRVMMQVNTTQPGGNSLYSAPKDGSGERQSVEVVAFAEWLKGQTGDFDVLKLDCEGAEWEILDHTPPEAFRRFRTIIAEAHTAGLGKHQLNDLPETLTRYGFKTLRWDGCHLGLYLGALSS